MKVEIMNIGDVKVLSVQGKIEASTAPELQEIILKNVAATDKLLLDLSEVEYMSSAGLRVMLILHRQISEGEGRVVLVGLQDRIRDAMQMTGFLKHFTVASDVKNGLELIH